jgi:hypothetical protein
MLASKSGADSFSPSSSMTECAAPDGAEVDSSVSSSAYMNHLSLANFVRVLCV